ncbi:MerR family transcriptional regulator [Aneurinibacillus terranovensis]|uniref:MerR family transcriptional regulator n=1 Tax=Aneurinibacillus terranovensis TaxID=278991 RepID=UPI00316AC5C1
MYINDMEKELKELTIQQVSSMTGMSVHTLRYYERIGLLEPVKRDANGYRLYSVENFAWIEFLDRLRTTGMSIRQMQTFATLRSQGPITVTERKLLLEEHRRNVQEQIQELEKNLAVIGEKIDYYTKIAEESRTDED